MIREITKRQLEQKTAQGERVVLIEALNGSEVSYDAKHIPYSVPMHVNRVRELASQYLPDTGAEIVIYGQDERTSATDAVAWLLSGMGYGNLYIYRGGKRDWFETSGPMEAIHSNVPASHTTHFKDKGLRMVREFASSTISSKWPSAPMVRAAGAFVTSRKLAPLLRGALWGLAIYGGVQLIRSLVRQRRERLEGTDEASELPRMPKHRIVQIDQSNDFEGTATSFHSASAAE